MIYNAEFDTRLIEQTCKKWGIESVPFESDCVMHTYMSWQGADRWISLSNAIGYDIEHRALQDCLAVYRLIENEGREWIVKREMTPELIELQKENQARLAEIWKKREEIWKKEQWEREQQELAEYYAFLELATSLEPINQEDSNMNKLTFESLNEKQMEVLTNYTDNKNWLVYKGDRYRHGS